MTAESSTIRTLKGALRGNGLKASLSACGAEGMREETLVAA
jgi:hypothetical protein